jgi:hypothetical protein
MKLYFSSEEAEILTDLTTMRRWIKEQPLHSEPCPLLLNQLNELEVVANRFHAKVAELKARLDRKIGQARGKE